MRERVALLTWNGPFIRCSSFEHITLGINAIRLEFNIQEFQNFSISISDYIYEQWNSHRTENDVLSKNCLVKEMSKNGSPIVTLGIIFSSPGEHIKLTQFLFQTFSHLLIAEILTLLIYSVSLEKSLNNEQEIFEH